MDKKNNTVFMMSVSAVTAIAVAVASYFIFLSISQKDSKVPDVGQIQEELAEFAMLHLYYDGLSLNTEAVLDKYDNKGNIIQQNIRLGDIIGGKKLVAVLSTNNCSSCARLEMTLLNKLGIDDNLLVIYDTPVHDYLSTSRLPVDHYYELTQGSLADGLEPKAELPLLLLTDGNRVQTSCMVNTSTSTFTRKFHEFAASELGGEQ